MRGLFSAYNIAKQHLLHSMAFAKHGALKSALHGQQPEGLAARTRGLTGMRSIGPASAMQWSLALSGITSAHRSLRSEWFARSKAIPLAAAVRLRRLHSAVWSVSTDDGAASLAPSTDALGSPQSPPPRADEPVSGFVLGSSPAPDAASPGPSSSGSGAASTDPLAPPRPAAFPPLDTIDFAAGASVEFDFEATVTLPGRSSSSGSAAAAAAADRGDAAPAAPESTAPPPSEAPPGDAPAPTSQLVLSSGAAMLPHPDKEDRGGEDSYFIAEAHACVGVADGVGGWAEIGVDAGLYARMLMTHAKEEAEAAAALGAPLSPQGVLERAFYRTDAQGSSTACVVALNGATLHASNLGDSGFLVVRGGRPHFQSPQQQHNFNFPYQLGSVDSMSDQPQAAMRFELPVQAGDIVVTGSDGLWDNVFPEEVATIVARCSAHGDSAEVAARVLARYARMRASDAKYNSPFSFAAIQAGYVYLGGKMDDISAVVSYVRSSAGAPPGSVAGGAPPGAAAAAPAAAGAASKL